MGHKESYIIYLRDKRAKDGWGKGARGHLEIFDHGKDSCELYLRIRFTKIYITLATKFFDRILRFFTEQPFGKYFKIYNEIEKEWVEE